MSKSVWTGSSWVPIKKEWVWDGANWVVVKSEKVWTGSTWKITWAPPVTSAQVSLSKASVQTNESFTASVLIPEGTPEGAVVTLKRDAATVTTWSPAVGTTLLSFPMTVASVGTFSMTAVIVTAGGTYTTVSVSLIVVATPTDIVVNGGHCHNILTGLAQAKAQKLTLKLTGTFYINTMVYIPDGVNVIATGAMFYVNSNSAVENATFNSGRFKNETNGSAPEYGQAGNFTWDGGTFDGNGEGIWTISHSPGFTIKNTTLYNYCSSGNTGHAIETNSSGGYDDPGGPYRVQILNNQFLGTNRGQRTNGNDEPCHFDWNWNGSGGSAPVWNPGDTVSEYNQVMCHNVLVQGNTFHRKAETGGWAFALCAIGGHKSSDASMTSSYRHNHFLYKDNIIHGAVGSSGTNPDKGAIHSFFIRQGVVQNNQLNGCNANRLLTGENATDVTYCSASGNTHNGAGNPNSYVVSNSTGA
jgi:hypothetical protein